MSPGHETRSVPVADRGCACVPDLASPSDRVAALRAVLTTETEPIVALTHLLRLCRDEHPTLWEHHADPRCRARVERLLADVASSLAAPGTATAIAPAARDAMAAALTATAGVPAVVVAHALAELLDRHYRHTFTDWFRMRSPYQPTVGDPIPLDRPDLRRVSSLPPTAPPWRLANRLDETPRIRLAGAWATQFRVVFDYSAFDALAGLIDDETIIATCHPNRQLDELGVTPDRREPAFPIQPRDGDEQRDQIDRLLGGAAAANASIVVLPELSVTADIAAELERWVRQPGPVRVLVAGTFHFADPAAPTKRANRALAWVRGHDQPLIQDKHSPADRPVIEDITPSGWPEIRVYVSADGWHLVIAVCRDLLNPTAVHTLTEAGANLVLAPSMTEALVPFGGPVAQLVGAGQALVAVANNPSIWEPAGRDHPVQPARALIGHPGFTQQTRQIHAPDDEPGLALVHVQSGRLQWHPDHRHLSEPLPFGEDDSPPAPGWVSLLHEYTAPPPCQPSTIELRTAAVLVVLTDGPSGPQVLLTGRASELTHYPDQFVFPGGAADPADRGPADTALREAHEEIGLDPTSVRVVGALPALALADSGYVVVPVVAWSPAPQLVHPPNPAEVAAMQQMPLSAWRQAHSGTLPNRGVVGVMTRTVLDLLAGILLAPEPTDSPCRGGSVGVAGPHV